MKGRVLNFNIQESKGIISGDDNNRYYFESSEWKSQDINPEKDVVVDFAVKEDKAIEIFAEKKKNGLDDFVKSDNIFVKYYINILKDKYFQFDGRARREEFWYFTLFSVLVSIVLSILNPKLSIIYSLAIFVPTIAIGARRLHDTDRSGWWQLLELIPIVGIIVLIVFWCLDGQKGDNRFGPDPKESN